MLKLTIGIIVLALVVVGWYLFRPELLFIDRTVHEELPTADTTMPTPDEAGPRVLVRGEFYGLAHDTQGVATIYQLGDERVLRLTDFETSNGPDVRVYLVAAADAKDEETVQNAGVIDLGSMKGNKGDQNYDIPAEVSLDRHRSVSIWCRRFSVNFGSAPLVRQGSASAAKSDATTIP